jgi:hypothetical protein
MGIFICMQKPTMAMIEAANHSGVDTYPVNAQKYPKVQLLTVEELLAGKRPIIPVTVLPYFQAQRRFVESDQMTFEIWVLSGLHEVEASYQIW